MQEETGNEKHKRAARVWQILVTTGSIAALILTVTQLCDWWENREPKLKLFVPYTFTGRSTLNDTLALLILARISNSHAKNAYLFPETMSVQVRSNNIWYITPLAWVTGGDFLVSDLPKNEEVSSGVNEIPILKRFENPIITYDNPLSRYIAVTHENESVLKNITDIRIEVEDCHKKLYEMEVNLVEQQRVHDPNYRHKN